WVLAYGICDTVIMFLVHHSLGHEEAQTRQLMQLEKDLRHLSVLEERHRLSREMHDGVGASLFGLMLQADYLSILSKGHEGLLQEIAELRLCAEEAMEEIRRCVSIMRDEFDLILQLQQTCMHFQARHKIPVHLKIEGTPPNLKYEAQFALFRVMQESLTNAAKHAKASSIDVEIQFSQQGYRLDVRDNGVGFDTSVCKKSH